MKSDRKTLADIFGVTLRTIDAWLKDGAPHTKSGNGHVVFVPREVIDWWFAWKTGSTLDLNKERARLAKEQADKTALENAEKRKVLVNAEDIAKDFSIIIGESRAKLLTLPRKIAIQCAGLGKREMESRAKELVYEALTELARMEPSTNMGPTTGTHHKRVGRPRKKAQPRSKR